MKYSFTPVSSGPGFTVQMPFIPVRLARSGKTVDADGLVDSGAMISVLSFDLGTRLGLDWNAQTHTLSLGGALGGPAKLVALEVTVAAYPAVPLLFAWSPSSNIRLILGQTNFFHEFDATFHRSRDYFIIEPKP
jgi:hypothetical protein